MIDAADVAPVALFEWAVSPSYFRASDWGNPFRVIARTISGDSQMGHPGSLQNLQLGRTA